MSSRLYVYPISLAILIAMILPVTWERHRDSFPLSPYPMFSRPRPDAMVTVSYAVGLDAAGERHWLAPRLVANEEVLQARAVLARAVREGPAEAARLCRAIAERVARRRADLVEVRIVTGRHDAVAYLTGRDRTGEERVHARCRVPR